MLMALKICWAKNNLCIHLKRKFHMIKKTLIILTLLVSSVAYSQDFNKNLATAKSSYGSKNLEDARFAMQQMLNDIDILVGKELLKILPAKLDALASDPKTDNVTANTGFAGVVVHRDYGTGEKTAA